MNHKIKKILLIAGIIEIVLGILHFAMPCFVCHSGGFNFLNHDEINFIVLCVVAVGILLLAFGFFTICFSFNIEQSVNLTFYYIIIKSLLWTGRIVLEILYPVKVPLFFIAVPTTIVMPAVIFEWFLFVYSAVLIFTYYRNVIRK